MGKYDADIEDAKQALIKANPGKPAEEWFIVQWATGWLIADTKALTKLPKRQLNKIIKLGGQIKK